MLLQVFTVKPLGIRFGRGNDGMAYVVSVDKNQGNVDDQIEVQFRSLAGSMLAW